MKCAAIDDEPLALELLREYISRIPSLELSGLFDDAIAGAEFVRNHPVDLLFLDINMPDITGLELAQSFSKPVMIIFTTAYKKFAFESYDLEAIDYLLKPIGFERFFKAVAKAFEYGRLRTNEVKNTQDSIFVRADYNLVRIDLNEIEYVESLEDYVKLHFTNHKPVMSLMTLKSVLEKLPASRFRRIHRSYIVSTKKIRSVLNRKVQLTQTELPIGESYAGGLTDWLKGS